MTAEIFYVCVCRDEPYSEDLWYDFTDFDAAIDFCRRTVELTGVVNVDLWSHCEGVDDILLNRWIYYV